MTQPFPTNPTIALDRSKILGLIHPIIVRNTPLPNGKSCPQVADEIADAILGIAQRETEKKA